MWCPLDNEKQNGMPCFRKLSKASWVTLWCHAIEASLIHRYSNIKNGCAQELGGQSNATNWRKVLAERLLNTAVHQAKIWDDIITWFVVVLAQASQLALKTSLKLLRYLKFAVILKRWKILHVCHQWCCCLSSLLQLMTIYVMVVCWLNRPGTHIARL